MIRSHGKILGIILIVAILSISYLWFLSSERQRTLSIKQEERDRRFFAVLTDDRAHGWIKTDFVSLKLDVKENAFATGRLSAGVFGPASDINFTLVFILPAGARVSDSAPGSKIFSGSYETVIENPVSTKVGDPISVVAVYFEWPNFSKPLRSHEWGFEIDLRSSHHRRDLHYLANPGRSPFLVEVSVTVLEENYRLINFYPSSEVNYQNSVSWLRNLSVLRFIATGTYQHENRYQYEPLLTHLVTLPLDIAGGVVAGLTALGLTQIYQFLKARNERRSAFHRKCEVTRRFYSQLAILLNELAQNLRTLPQIDRAIAFKEVQDMIARNVDYAEEVNRALLQVDQLNAQWRAVNRGLREITNTLRLVLLRNATTTNQQLADQLLRIGQRLHESSMGMDLNQIMTKLPPDRMRGSTFFATKP